jgi:SAM-dependent methyltransferase
VDDVDARSAPDRRTWLRELRRRSERQEDALASRYDELWGQVEATHRRFVERFLWMLPRGGTVLDAACGTGKYFPIVIESGRSSVGVDQSGAALARARSKFPSTRTENHGLQDLSYRAEFDGVMCVDAMEFVCPEDWPEVLRRFRRALRPAGWLYLTVELVSDEEVGAANRRARESGLPVVDGEVIWEEPDGYYHFYPPITQVRRWLDEAGFVVREEAEEPWNEEGYSYHHLLARLEGEEGSDHAAPR